MHPFTVCFFGNRIIDNPMDAEKALNGFIPKLLRENTYVVFLVGRDGEFDQLAASFVHRCKRTIRSDNSSLVWVMPYLTAEYRDNEAFFQQYFDEIEVCEEGIGKHFKLFINFLSFAKIFLCRLLTPGCVNPISFA